MLDIRLLRNSPEKIKDGVRNRGGRYLAALDELLAKDTLYRSILLETEDLRSKRNEISELVKTAKIHKKDPEAEQQLMKDANSLKEVMLGKEDRLAQVRTDVENLLLGIPNPPHESVKIGQSAENNTFLRKGPTPVREFNFKPEDHHSIGERLKILDFVTAGKLSGARFSLLKGAGARLERAIINFMLDTHTNENGYTEIFPPFLVTSQAMTGTGQLPKFEDDLYKIISEPPLYLIPTAEVPLTNIYRDSILKDTDLPMQFTACTACFRQEAGSYGKDTRGLIRNHQFNKVELVWLAKPEDSMRNLEKLTLHAEEILTRLGLPYRVVELCTGDMGFSACKTYDLEVWMPSENCFREISSCSNCWDFQARRMNTRFKRAGAKGTEFIHTLNGSGVAVGRTFAAILENYQNKDGSVSIPAALLPYFGKDTI